MHCLRCSWYMCGLCPHTKVPITHLLAIAYTSWCIVIFQIVVLCSGEGGDCGGVEGGGRPQGGRAVCASHLLATRCACQVDGGLQGKCCLGRVRLDHLTPETACVPACVLPLCKTAEDAPSIHRGAFGSSQVQNRVSCAYVAALCLWHANDAALGTVCCSNYQGHKDAYP